MTRALSAACGLALILPAAVAAQPPPAIPPTKDAPQVVGGANIEAPAAPVPPYKLVRLKVAAGDGEAVTWRVRPGKDVDWSAGSEGPAVAFVAPPGRYAVEVFVVGVKDGRPVLRIDETEVVIGTPGPPPPPPPPKVNPLRAPLKAAFDADPGEGPDKDKVRKDLAELYALAATMAADPAVTTTDILRERLRRAAASLASDQLFGTRTAISNVLAPVLPLGQPLTPESRAAAAETFRQVSDALSW
jgi:hypothetical protein